MGSLDPLLLGSRVVEDATVDHTVNVLAQVVDLLSHAQVSLLLNERQDNSRINQPNLLRKYLGQVGSHLVDDRISLRVSTIDSFLLEVLEKGIVKTCITLRLQLHYLVVLVSSFNLLNWFGVFPWSTR